MIAVAAAAPAAAAPVDTFQLQTYVGSRIWNQAAWIPFAIDSPPGRVHVLRHAGRSFRGVWVPATIGRRTTTEALANAWTSRRSARPAAIADRVLSAREQRRHVLVGDLYRDADVLVVARDHPACAGLTRAQARAVVRGRIKRWSELVPGARADAIAVRYPSTGGDAGAESHFGLVRPLRRWARMPYALGAKGATDGGVGAALAGDHAVAAVSMWSRVRRLGCGGLRGSARRRRAHRRDRRAARLSRGVPRRLLPAAHAGARGPRGAVRRDGRAVRVRAVQGEAPGPGRAAAGRSGRQS